MKLTRPGPSVCVGRDGQTSSHSLARARLGPQLIDSHRKRGFGAPFGLHKNHPAKIRVFVEEEIKTKRVHIKLLIYMHRLITVRAL
jgi:hypothetical protein